MYYWQGMANSMDKMWLHYVNLDSHWIKKYCRHGKLDLLIGVLQELFVLNTENIYQFDASVLCYGSTCAHRPKNRPISRKTRQVGRQVVLGAVRKTPVPL